MSLPLQPTSGQVSPLAQVSEDEDVARRRALLDRLHDDRQDLVRVAGVVRNLAERFEVAQSSLSMLRRGLHWLALAGGAAALTISVRTGRRTPVLLLTGLSLYLAQRWLSNPVRPELGRAAVGTGTSTLHPPVYRHAIAPVSKPARPQAM